MTGRTAISLILDSLEEEMNYQIECLKGLRSTISKLDEALKLEIVNVERLRCRVEELRKLIFGEA